MLKIATVTMKNASQQQYAVYRVPGSSGDYPVWVASATGYACYCPCKARTFNPHKRCRHMLLVQQWLDERRAAAPLYRKEFSMTR